jgi:hypothetical protein
MSIESEIQKTVREAVEKAMEAKGGPLPGIPILAMLVGAPMMKPREAMLIDVLFGMLIGALIDRGDNDEKILAKCESTLRAIRTAMTDSTVLERIKILRAEMDRVDPRS